MNDVLASFSVDDGIAVARLSGELDIANAVEICDDLLSSMPNDALGLVLDFAELRYVDSAGVRMLFGLAQRLQTCRQRLALLLPEASPLVRLVKITHLNEVATVCPDLEDCCANMRDPH